MSLILIVDDEASVRYTLKEVLEEEGYKTNEASTGEEALKLLQTVDIELIISDLSMPGMDGMSLLEKVKDLERSPLFIMITAFGSERHAVEAIKLGAYDYLKKPFDIDEVVLVVNRALRSIHLQEENRKLRARLALGRQMVFNSEAMFQIADTVDRIADKDVNILITGESGTGKELVADAIVEASHRKSKPFIRFNSSAVPENLLEAALFGHEKGAYTGADRSRPGYFQEADGGTLFLDEIGEMPLFAQVKLLRTIQSGEIQPVGGSARNVNVRLIAATNRNLKKAVDEGTFREDLYYRLHVVEIQIPPLRERKSDTPLLMDHFFKKYADKFGIRTLSASQEIKDMLIQKDWPGNVRELEHTIESITALSNNGVIDDSLIDLDSQITGEPLSLKAQVEAFERGIILKAFKKNSGNQSETARHLGISRVTLIDKLKKYGLK